MRALSSMSRAHAVHDGHSLGQGCVRAVCVVTRSGLDGSTGLQPHPAQLPPPPLARQPATPPPEQRMWRPSRAVLRLAARHLQNPVAGGRAAACGLHSLARSGAAAGHHGPWHGATGAAMLMVGAAAMLGFAPTALADSGPGSLAREELSFIMVKPDGVHRGLVADIIGRFEKRGYKLVGIKVLVPTPALAAKHYAEHDGKPFFPKLVDFLSSGPVVAMVWEGKEVVKTARAMIGLTNPLASAPGTIRGDLGIDVGRNVVHGSDSVESAQREIALWFKAEELASYEPSTCAWVYE